RQARSKGGVKPLPSRSRRPVPRNTKAKARISAISQNPSARKLTVIRINRSARASRTWVRADGEKAALLWAERMRQGRPREDANLRERAEMGLERRAYRANSGRTITTIGGW